MKPYTGRRCHREQDALRNGGEMWAHFCLPHHFDRQWRAGLASSLRHAGPRDAALPSSGAGGLGAARAHRIAAIGYAKRAGPVGLVDLRCSRKNFALCEWRHALGRESTYSSHRCLWRRFLPNLAPAANGGPSLSTAIIPSRVPFAVRLRAAMPGSLAASISRQATHCSAQEPLRPCFGRNTRLEQH